jgi:ArsR family transcriptional regulator
MQEIFKALSDETRLRMLAVIWQREMCVCEIEQVLELTQSNASRHLSSLKNAGMIIGEKHAQWMYYRINDGFCLEHAALCEYLKGQFTGMSSYQGDMERLKGCGCGNLCGCKE